MVSRICPSCGKEIKEDEVTINNLCQDCFLKNAELLGKKRKIEFKICKRCKKIKHKMEFIKMGKDKEEAIKKYLKKYPNFLLKPEGKITTLKFKDFKKIGDEYEATIKFYGIVNKNQTKEVKQEAKIRVIPKEVFCKRCMQIKQKKWRAKIQIRGKKMDLQDPLFVGKGIIKIEEKKRGWDLFFLRNRKAKIVARELKDRYDGKISQHPSLIGEKNGERIYKYTYSLRI